MKRGFAVPALGLACALFVNAETPFGQPPQQPPSFASESSDLVLLPVTVVDRQGRFVADLPQERFVVYDDGRPQPIALFSNEDTPVTVGLIIDASGSMTSKFGEVIAAALVFARSSNPLDELFAIAFNDTVKDAAPGRPLTASDLTGLESALTALRTQGR